MSSVPSSLLQLKLRPPQLAGPFLSRPVLLQRLDQSLDAALTVITAPAGSGKTSLVTEWLSTRQQPVGWISLDQKDGDLSRFAAYFIAAVCSVYPEAGASARMLLNAPVPLSPAAMADALLRDLTALPGSLLLVLDDYYRAETEETNQLLRHLLRIPPPHLHLVLTTRSDPALPLGRLRSRFQLVEIRTEDLRFSRGETAHLLNLLAGRAVDDDDVVLLQEHTEGWAVGLQLAGVLLHEGRVQPDFAAQFSSRSHRWIMEYLADEVLAHLPHEMRAVLFQTAIFDRFCAPLLEAVLSPMVAPGHGGAVIDYLDGANLFLIPLDNTQTWFRFHHLFRDFLERSLSANMAKGNISQLRVKASVWFAAHGLIDDAIEYARAAGNDERVVQLIEAHLYRVLNEEDARQLDRWLALIPEAMRIRPAVLVAQAYRQQWRFQIEALPSLLNQAAAGLANDVGGYTPEESRSWQGAIACLRAFYSGLDGDGVNALEQSRLALRLAPSEWRFVRGLTELSYSVALRLTDQMSEAVTFCNRQLAESSTTTDSRTLRLLLALCNCHYGSANAHELLSTGRTYLRAAEKLERPISLGWAHFCVGWAHYQRNELDAAEANFRNLVAMRQGIHVRALVDGYTGLALTQAAKGRTDDAYAVVQELQNFLIELQALPLLPVAESLMVRLKLLQGIESGVPLPGDAAHQYRSEWWELPILTCVRACLAAAGTDDLDRAGALLRICREQAQSRRIVRQHIELGILSAQYNGARGNTETALAELSQAIARAQSGGIVRMFIDAGPTLRPLLQQLETHRSELPHIRRILAAYEAEPPAPAVPSSGLTSQRTLREVDIELIAQLSFREREVLMLMAKQLTNAEIADHLTIALPTVKRHTHSIFRKLGAANRRQAAAKAVAIGLIPSASHVPSS